MMRGSGKSSPTGLPVTQEQQPARRGGRKGMILWEIAEQNPAR